MFRRLVRPLFALLVVSLFGLLTASSGWSHDSWISRDGHRNAAGEWCCGEGDCFVVPGESVNITADGYRLFGVETVPFQEAQPSPDGAYWRCRRNDGSRRCFFAPPQSY
ncbi:MAG TPA: hypothetical protein VKE26_07670 [Xanthobacteraceae bacterium]|nr:hypothetical protein [Xanthobacteraceae bacterium]